MRLFNRLKINFGVILTLGIIFLIPGDALAAGGSTSVASILQKIVDFLQGDIARLTGLVAIAGCGYLCIVKQRLPKEQFMMVLLGLGIIFGSSSLYSTLVA